MATSLVQRSRLRRALAIGLGILALLSAAWFSLTRRSVRSLAREPWPAEPPSAHAWPDVFVRGARVELHSLDTGAVHIARRKMLAPHHPEGQGYREEAEALHVFAHLIRHPTRGDFLVDSGLDASFANDEYGNIQRPARWILALLFRAPYSQTPGTDVFSRLARLDAHPRAIFLTHLHMDHTAGIPGMPADTEIVTGAGEADDPVQIFGYGHFTNARRLRELDFGQARDMPPLGPALDLFGDGSVWAISTPGHTRGHVSFVVRATTGMVLLVGDASHFRWAFEHGVGPSGTSGEDDAVAQASLDRLRAFAHGFPEVTVFTGHEVPARARP